MGTKYIAEVIGLLQSEGGRFYFTAFSKEFSKTDTFRVYLSSKEWLDVPLNLTLYGKVQVTRLDNGSFYLDRLMPSKYVYSQYHIYNALERFHRCYMAAEESPHFTGMGNTAIAIIAGFILLSSQQSLGEENNDVRK